MGRPKLNQYQRRTQKVNLYVTKQEYVKFIRLAEEYNMSISSMIRHIVLTEYELEEPLDLKNERG